MTHAGVLLPCMWQAKHFGCFAQQSPKFINRSLRPISTLSTLNDYHCYAATHSATTQSKSIYRRTLPASYVIADQPQCGPDTRQAAPGSEAPKSAAARLWSRLATAMLLIAPAPEAKCKHRSIQPPTRGTDGSSKTTCRWARRGTTAAGEGMMALGLGAPECDPPQGGRHLAILRQRRLALPTVRQPQTLQSTHATASKQRRSPH